MMPPPISIARSACFLMAPGNWYVTLFTGTQLAGTITGAPCLLYDARMPSMASRFLAEDGFAVWSAPATNDSPISSGAVALWLQASEIRKVAFIQNVGSATALNVYFGSLAGPNWTQIASLQQFGSLTLAGSALYKGQIGIRSAGAAVVLHSAGFQGLE